MYAINNGYTYICMYNLDDKFPEDRARVSSFFFLVMPEVA